MFGWFNKDTEESLREEYEKINSAHTASHNHYIELKEKGLSYSLFDNPIDAERFRITKHRAWIDCDNNNKALDNIEKRMKKFVRKYG